jgi:hypothetical protein
MVPIWWSINSMAELSGVKTDLCIVYLFRVNFVVLDGWVASTEEVDGGKLGCRNRHARGRVDSF